MAGEKLKQDKDTRHRQDADEDLFGILGMAKRNCMATSWVVCTGVVFTAS